MRIAATGAILLFVLQACSTTQKASESPFQQPNSLIAGEITRRIEQIPYQHREELLNNLVWLSNQGEPVIPATLEGLRHNDAKVRSSCAWVLGRIHDRRTIPNLQSAMRDNEIGVRLEVARSLVAMGDLAPTPTLIEGLDSDKKEVRYMCHETLKTATGRDFGYDHLNANETEMRLSVLRWRQWWGEQSGDAFFAQSYQNQYHLQAAVAAPNGETKPIPETPVGNDAAPLPIDSPNPTPNGTPNATPNGPSNQGGSPNPTPNPQQGAGYNSNGNPMPSGSGNGGSTANGTRPNGG